MCREEVEEARPRKLPQSSTYARASPLHDKVVDEAREARSACLRIDPVIEEMCKFLPKISRAFLMKSNEPF